MVTYHYVAFMAIFLSIITESSKGQGPTNLINYNGIADVVENLVSFGTSDLNIISDFKLPSVQSDFLSKLNNKGRIF